VLWQIAAMWLYETKLHWRRRPLKVVFLTLVITTAISNLIIVTGVSKVDMNLIDVTGLALEQGLLVKGVFLMSISMSILTIVQMLILPLVLADSVALDESDNMMEILHSTPLPGWVYLVRKIGGVWWASMSAIVLALIIISVIDLVVTGPYNVIPMIDGRIVLSIPAVLFNGGFALLMGATQPTRRRAILFVIGVFLLCVYLAGPTGEGSLTALSPFDGSFLPMIFAQASSRPSIYSPVFTLPGVMDFLIGRGLVFLITALIVGTWWTLRWSGVSLRPKTTPMPTPLPVQQESLQSLVENRRKTIFRHHLQSCAHLAQHPTIVQQRTTTHHDRHSKSLEIVHRRCVCAAKDQHEHRDGYVWAIGAEWSGQDNAHAHCGRSAHPDRGTSHGLWE